MGASAPSSTSFCLVPAFQIRLVHESLVFHTGPGMHVERFAQCLQFKHLRGSGFHGCSRALFSYEPISHRASMRNVIHLT